MYPRRDERNVAQIDCEATHVFKSVLDRLAVGPIR